MFKKYSIFERKTNLSPQSSSQLTTSKSACQRTRHNKSKRQALQNNHGPFEKWQDMFLPVLDLTQLDVTVSCSVLSPQKEMWLEQLAPHVIHPNVVCASNPHPFSFVLMSMGMKSVPKKENKSASPRGS